MLQFYRISVHRRVLKWLTFLTALVSTGLYTYYMSRDNSPLLELHYTNNYFSYLDDYIDLGYIVDTPDCKILNISAFDKALLPFRKVKSNWVNCGYITLRQWTYTDGTDLVINETSVENSGYTVGSLSCCYMYISRIEQTLENYDAYADFNVLFSRKCFPLTKIRTHIPATHEFLRVQCKGKYWPFSSDILYREFHAIPQYPKNSETERKAEFWTTQNILLNKTPNQQPPMPNVMIIGIDSVSRLSFHRNMPKTKEVLERLGATEMLGYTKVGENTMPNAISFMTGYSLAELRQTCLYTDQTPSDACPYIWKRFNASQYLTAMVEDAPRVAIFQYLKTGFVKPPVDYFFRPFMVGVHQHTPNAYYTVDCIGSKTVDEVLLKYIRELQDSSIEKKSPLFLISWLTNLAHGNMNAAKDADGIYASFLNSLDLNNTVLFFISDHGYRFWGIRQTFPGWYEDKLPNFWAYLPPTVKHQFPDWQKSLQANTRRLTTPYDLFHTLSHILDTFTNTSQLAQEKSLDGKTIHRKYGQSLFTEIPLRRDCKAAGVADPFCACMVPGKMEYNDTRLIEAAEAAVKSINAFIPTQCSPLRLSRVTSGASLKTNFEARKGESHLTVSYIVAFITEPGMFLFESNVNYSPVGQAEFRFNVTGSLRMNKITTDVSCIRDSHLEKYCYC